MAARGRRVSGFVAALALLTAVLWLAWPAMSRRGEPAASGDREAGESRAESVVAAAPGQDHDDGAGSAPLPPDDAPLAGILGPLAARADAGDRKAACRLAMELLRCEHLLDSASFADRLGSGREGDDAGSSRQRDGVDEYLARERLWIGERLEQCEAVPDDLLDAGARYLEQAALAGEPEAMVRYAEGHHWAPTGRGVMAGPAFDRWRRNAPGMMQRALESGHPGAAFLLMLAYRDDYGFHSALIPNDLEQSMVMNTLYARLYGAQVTPSFYRGMDAASQARAIERAESMHLDYFQGRRFRGYPYPTPAHLAPMGGETTHRFCTAP